MREPQQRQDTHRVRYQALQVRIGARVGQSDMVKATQDPSTHTNYRGRATLIVNWVVLSKQVSQLCASSWVRAQRLDERLKLSF